MTTNPILSATRNSRVALGIGALIGAGLSVAGLNKINNSKSNVGQDPFKDESIYYPEDLGNIGHWIELRAKSTDGQLTAGALGSALASVNLENSVNASNFLGSSVAGATIRLPMTNNLSTDYNPQYTSQDLKMTAGSILKPFDRQMYGNKDISQDAAMGAGMSAVGAATLGGIISTKLGVGAGGGDVAEAALKVGAGLASNPHKIVLFTGVDFREHSFTWRLAPRNKTETQKIKRIIDMLVYYSHPQYTFGGLFFKYPEFFEISFYKDKYLFKLRPSVCTDVRVNYHSQGYAGYIRSDGDDPAPVEIELSLSFRETEIITKDYLATL